MLKLRVLQMILLLSFPAFAWAQIASSTPVTAQGKYGTMTVRKPYENENPDQEVYKVVEQMPVFPGGQVGLMRYLSSIPYPKEALENGIQGKVYLSFVIDTSGNITQPKIARSSGNQILDNASLEHLRSMPKWQPGRQRRIAVKVEMVVPLYFKLS